MNKDLTTNLAKSWRALTANLEEQSNEGIFEELMGSYKHFATPEQHRRAGVILLQLKMLCVLGRRLKLADPAKIKETEDALEEAATNPDPESLAIFDDARVEVKVMTLPPELADAFRVLANTMETKVPENKEPLN